MNSVRQNPFSLLELLIVVAMIAILTGLLLPALNKARDSAYLASCLSNLKQQYTGFAGYAADFKDYLPGRPSNFASATKLSDGDSNGADPSAISYLFYANNYLGIKTRKAGSNAYWDHVRLSGKINDVLVCPSLPKPQWEYRAGAPDNIYDGNSTKGAVTYAVPLGTHALPNGYLNLARIGRKIAPGSLAIVFDRLYFNNSKYAVRLAAHRGLKGNILSADGAAKNAGISLYYQLYTTEGFGIPSATYYIYLGKKPTSSPQYYWKAPGNLERQAGSADGCPFL